MAISYSAAARTQSNTDANNSSTLAPATSAGPSSKSNIKHLILDAGPLLSLTPLRHLATSFHTTPLVLAELRDPKAREHWDRLALTGVDVRVEPPSADAMAKVIAFAKKTGDYAVLSQTDLSVVALTYQYEAKVNGEARIRITPGQVLPQLAGAVPSTKVDKEGESGSEDEEDDGAENQEGAREEETNASNEERGFNTEEYISEDQQLASEQLASHVHRASEAAVVDDVEDITLSMTSLGGGEREAIPEQASSGTVATQAANEDSESDGGEWITPSNVKQHRSHDLGLLPDESRAIGAPLAAACMTGDYAVQNVLLAMGLGLVGEGGKRISKVRSWVLRCHACFKLCKDSSKRFCPSCGNSSLMRTTVTTSATTGKQTIHLKKNFQYHLRGTKYSIPDPKPGRAKGQQKGGSGLILREDQAEWQDAVKTNQRQREKEEKRAAKGDGGWMDPDWLPEIITVGMNGKGRAGGRGMPAIGHGRRNPNQAKKRS